MRKLFTVNNPPPSTPTQSAHLFIVNNPRPDPQHRTGLFTVNNPLLQRGPTL
ncbi:Uncharacterised protein [Mycobacteroides abscessus subsp. abscessus]|nr:Uncharacterised protein [Mycobacteroides abscessus subsp. abscessus]